MLRLRGAWPLPRTRKFREPGFGVTVIEGSQQSQTPAFEQRVPNSALFVLPPIASHEATPSKDSVKQIIVSADRFRDAVSA